MDMERIMRQLGVLGDKIFNQYKEATLTIDRWMWIQSEIHRIFIDKWADGYFISPENDLMNHRREERFVWYIDPLHRCASDKAIGIARFDMKDMNCFSCLWDGSVNMWYCYESGCSSVMIYQNGEFRKYEEPTERYVIQCDVDSHKIPPYTIRVLSYLRGEGVFPTAKVPIHPWEFYPGEVLLNAFKKSVVEKIPEPPHITIDTLEIIRSNSITL